MKNLVDWKINKNTYLPYSLLMQYHHISPIDRINFYRPWPEHQEKKKFVFDHRGCCVERNIIELTFLGLWQSRN